jgi:hypothetical protein
MAWLVAAVEQFITVPLFSLRLQRKEQSLFLLAPSTAMLEDLNAKFSAGLTPPLIDSTFALDADGVNAVGFAALVALLRPHSFPRWFAYHPLVVDAVR